MSVPTAPVVIAAMAKPFVNALSASGIDPVPILERYAISPEAMNSPNVLIAVQDWYDFVEAAAIAANDRYFGFKIGNRRSLAELPNMDRVEFGAATLAEVLIALVIDSERITTLATYHIAIDGHQTDLKSRRTFEPARPSPQIDGFFAGFMLRLFHEVTGSTWSPDALRVTVRNPNAIPQDALPRRCVLRGGSRRTSFRFPAEWLLMEFDSGRHQARIDDEVLSLDFVERFRDILRARLSTPQFTIAQAACLAGITPRQLRERLATANSNFSQEIHRLRAEHAHDLLVRIDMSIAEIGAAVGYPDPTGFSRIFKSWTSQSPREYRKQR